MNEKENAVDKIYKIYLQKGFVTEDEIFDVCEEMNVSVFDTDYVTNKVYDMGILVTDKLEKDNSTDNDELTDYAQKDYNIIYDFFLYNFPEMKKIIDTAKNTQPVQHGEINKLFIQLRSGNSHVKNIIFQKYIRIALSNTYNYREKTFLSLEDLFQVACMSLLKAIDSYAINENSSFTSYCSSWIMQGIERYIADNESLIRIPMHFREKYDEVFKIAKLIPNANNKDLLQIFTQITGDTKDDADSFVQAYNESQNIFFEDICEPFDYIYLCDYDNVETLALNTIENSVLQNSISKLTEREIMVINLRYGLNGYNESNLEEIGNIFNITRERVRQINLKALRKLRFMLNEKYNDDI